MSGNLSSHYRSFTAPQLRELLVNNEQLTIIDARSADSFTQGFIPGSIFLGLEGKMVEWAVNLLATDAPIVLVTPSGKEVYCCDLIRDAGFTRVLGYLEGSFEAWKEVGGAVDMIINIDAGELAMDIPFDEHLVVVDVRRPVEFAEGHVQDAVNIPLDTLRDPGSIADLSEKDNLYLHCAAGYRSVIAASLFKIQGYHNLRNITGGWEFIKHTKGITVVKEPTALN